MTRRRRARDAIAEMRRDPDVARDGNMALPCSAVSLRIRSRIWAWTVTSSPLVASSEIRKRIADQRDGDHRARAMPRRSRADRRSCAVRIRDLNRLQHLEPPVASGLPVEAEVDARHGGYLIADLRRRVQFAARIRHDHGEPTAAQKSELLFRQSQDVASFEITRPPAMRPEPAERKDPPGQRCLASAALADQPRTSPGLNRQVESRAAPCAPAR